MLQKLQTAPRDRTIEAQWSKILSENGDRRGRNFLLSIPHIEYIIGAAAGLLILGLLTHPTGGGIIALGILAAIILPWSIYCTSRHVSWLLLVLVLIEAVAASALAAGSDAKLGAVVPYPLRVLFFLPVLVALWRLAILR